MSRFRDRFAGRSLRVAPALTYALVDFVASVADLPPGGLPPSGPLGLVGFDKWIHVTSYAVFAVLVVVAFGPITRRSLSLTAALVSVYGVGIELVQSLFPLRTTSRYDVFANEFGIAVGLALVVGVAWARAKRAHRQSVAD